MNAQDKVKALEAQIAAMSIANGVQGASVAPPAAGFITRTVKAVTVRATSTAIPADSIPLGNVKRIVADVTCIAANHKEGAPSKTDGRVFNVDMLGICGDHSGQVLHGGCRKKIASGEQLRGCKGRVFEYLTADGLAGCQTCGAIARKSLT